MDSGDGVTGAKQGRGDSRVVADDHGDGHRLAQGAGQREKKPNPSRRYRAHGTTTFQVDSQRVAPKPRAASR